MLLAESNNETIDSIEQKNSSDNQSNLVSEQDAEVQFNLGLMYSEGQGVKQDYFTQQGSHSDLKEKSKTSQISKS